LAEGTSRTCPDPLSYVSLLLSLIRYTKTTRDPLVPSVWGPVDKKDDPYTAACKSQSPLDLPTSTSPEVKYQLT
jgi:hypothetical protein